jgi:hypothetical protein
MGIFYIIFITKSIENLLPMKLKLSIQIFIRSLIDSPNLHCARLRHFFSMRYFFCARFPRVSSFYFVLTKNTRRCIRGMNIKEGNALNREWNRWNIYFGLLGKSVKEKAWWQGGAAESPSMQKKVESRTQHNGNITDIFSGLRRISHSDGR